MSMKVAILSTVLKFSGRCLRTIFAGKREAGTKAEVIWVTDTTITPKQDKVGECSCLLPCGSRLPSPD